MNLPTEQFGYEFARGAIRAVARLFFWCLVIILLGNWAIDQMGWRAFDSTDDAITKERSGLRIYTDHGTRCQYLATAGGLLTPRLNGDGVPVCGFRGLAQGTEAGTAETVKLGSVHDGPVAKPCAQPNSR